MFVLSSERRKWMFSIHFEIVRKRNGRWRPNEGSKYCKCSCIINQSSRQLCKRARSVCWLSGLRSKTSVSLTMINWVEKRNERRRRRLSNDGNGQAERFHLLKASILLMHRNQLSFHQQANDVFQKTISSGNFTLILRVSNLFGSHVQTFTRSFSESTSDRAHYSRKRVENFAHWEEQRRKHLMAWWKGNLRWSVARFAHRHHNVLLDSALHKCAVQCVDESILVFADVLAMDWATLNACQRRETNIAHRDMKTNHRSEREKCSHGRRHAWENRIAARQMLILQVLRTGISRVWWWWWP